MPILGKLADLYGRKRMYLSCMALFILLFRIEAKAKEAIIPLHLFKNRNVVVLSALVFTLMLGMSVFGSLLSQQIKNGVAGVSRQLPPGRSCRCMIHQNGK
jgi:MFS family permease